MKKWKCNKHNELTLYKVVKVDGIDMIQPYCLSCESEIKFEILHEEYLNNVKANNSKKLIHKKPGYTFMDSINILLVFLGLFSVPIIFATVFFELSFMQVLLLCLIIGLIGIFAPMLKIRKKNIFREPSLEEIRYSIERKEVPHRNLKVENFKKKLHKQFVLDSVDIKRIDEMDGYLFEEFIANIFKKRGYRDIKVTKKSGDNGVDIFMKDEKNHKIAVQCKRYKITNTVGISAVQEIHTAKSLYRCSQAMIVTTSFLSKSAVDAAKTLKVIVIDRNLLIEMLYEVVGINENWEKYLQNRCLLPTRKNVNNV